MSLLDQLPSCFSEDYKRAQSKFREACSAAGLQVEDYPHPLKGANGEALATLAARYGPLDAENLVLVISGTHGLEGLAGSGGQVAWLRHGVGQVPADTAVLLVHLLNPWGCSWGRRQTEENADLNRSFLDRPAANPANETYRAFYSLLAGASSDTPAEEDAALRTFFEQRDFNEAVGALMMGQHDFPDGLGFCGSQPSWSEHALATILGRHAVAPSRVAAIDLHTGLGPFGHGSLLSLAPGGCAELARARQWYGPSLGAVKEGEGVYLTRGELLNWVAGQVPGDCTGVVVEYGTFDVRRLVMLQIDDARIWRDGAQETERGELVRRNLRDFFYPNSFDWRQSVAFRALQVVDMAIRGLHETAA